jgi:hypothetical protein
MQKIYKSTFKRNQKETNKIYTENVHSPLVQGGKMNTLQEFYERLLNMFWIVKKYYVITIINKHMRNKARTIFTDR